MFFDKIFVYTLINPNTDIIWVITIVQEVDRMQFDAERFKYFPKVETASIQDAIPRSLARGVVQVLI